jgi:hypothetical protein
MVGVGLEWPSTHQWTSLFLLVALVLLFLIVFFFSSSFLFLSFLMLFLKYFVLIWNLLFFLVSLLAFLHIFSLSCFFLFFMCVGPISLEQDKHLEKHHTLLQGLATLVSSKITMQNQGEFGTRLDGKTQQSLRTSQLSFKNISMFFFCFSIFLVFFPQLFSCLCLFFACLLLCLLFWFVFQFLFFFVFQNFSVCVFFSFIHIYVRTCFLFFTNKNFETFIN